MSEDQENKGNGGDKPEERTEKQVLTVIEEPNGNLRINCERLHDIRYVDGILGAIRYMSGKACDQQRLQAAQQNRSGIIVPGSTMEGKFKVVN